MRQISFDAHGGPQVLTLVSVPEPTPGIGEVRIRVIASGINRADVAQREGSYRPPADASPVLGLEVSGVIDALGAGVSGWQLGDAVCSLTPGGGYAECVCVPATHCLPIPQGVSQADAAALPEVAMTVWSNLVGHAQLKAGERLLVHGGTSGIGSFAIAWAVALGHTVLTTVGSDDKLEHVNRWGAKGIQYRRSDFVQEVMTLTHGEGVDVVLDMVGGDYVQRNLQCLARGGRIVQIAFQNGADVQINLWDLLRRQAVLTGSLLRPRTVADKAAIVSALRQNVWPMYASGRLSPPVIDSVYTPEDIHLAHERMELSSHVGKMLLRWS